MTAELDGKVPSGPIEERWDQHKFDMKLVAPHNRRRFKVIVIGTGLAGNLCITIHDVGNLTAPAIYTITVASS